MSKVIKAADKGVTPLAAQQLHGLVDIYPQVKLRRGLARLWADRPNIVIGGAIVILLVAIAILAPLLGTTDPSALSPRLRLRGPSAESWFGRDGLGQDVYSRVIYGTRVSLTVGIVTALLATSIGIVLGVVAGFVRWLDNVVMRVMDALMAIPAILLAIALMTLLNGSMGNVILAITLSEVPRVARLVRGVVLSLREMPYVDAAVASGSTTMRIILRHILPNTAAPVTVQATYICASAMLIEAGLSFIGAGVPVSTPSWGNIMAEGRTLWQIKPHMIFFPAAFLCLAVLAVNMLGDGLRDALDPRSARNG